VLKNWRFKTFSQVFHFDRDWESVKERVGGGQQISWHLAAQAKKKAAHGHVVHAVQRGAVLGTL